MAAMMSDAMASTSSISAATASRMAEEEAAAQAGRQGGMEGQTGRSQQSRLLWVLGGLVGCGKAEEEEDPAGWCQP